MAAELTPNELTPSELNPPSEPINPPSEQVNLPEPLNAPMPETAPSPWQLPKKQAAFLLLFAFVVSLVVFLRFFQLESLQAEIYGDIEIVMGYVKDIFMLLWPKNFVLSAGPLYHYLIVPIIYLTGQNYMGVKVASVMVSLVGLAATYAFSRRLVNDYFALVALFVAGVSSWLLVFSRLGNSQIALPVLTMLTLWLMIRVVQFGKQRDVIACAIVSSLGLFIYPQSFIQPGVTFATLLCLAWAKHALPKKWWVYFAVDTIPALILFWFVFASDPGNFDGYIGNKIRPTTGNSAVALIGANIFKTATALHIRGDEGYRSNPSGLPHLDWLSGIFFIAGVVYWFTDKEKRRWAPLWLVPLILLQIPSILVISNTVEVPSASRTLGAAPIVYLLVASGLWWLAQFLYKRTKLWQTAIIIGVLLGGILYLNAQRYFQNYISGLPYNNIPIGLQVATYANLLPKDTQVYMVGCCWADGIPDNFIKLDMLYPDNMHYTDPGSLTCLQLQTMTAPTVLIWNYQNEVPAPQLEPCKEWIKPQHHTYHNTPIFNIATLHTTELDAPLPPEVLDPLVNETTQVNGESIVVEYSPIDMGSLGDLFDGKADTLMRGNRVNPMVIVLHFPSPRKLSTVDVRLGSMLHFQVKLTVTYADHTTQDVQNDYTNQPSDPQVSISLPESDQQVTDLRVEITDFTAAPGDEHIHVRELETR